jgi:hypothetical protein
MRATRSTTPRHVGIAMHSTLRMMRFGVSAAHDSAQLPRRRRGASRGDLSSERQWIRRKRDAR